MKPSYIFPFLLVITISTLFYSSCSVLSTNSHAENAHATVKPNIVSYNELTMNLDAAPVTYTIDISTTEGKLKLHKISLSDAEKLALTECLMKYNCATLFNPQYTHLKKGKDILRVAVYGFPARYKRIDTEHDTETEIVEEKHDTGASQSRTTKTTTKTRARSSKNKGSHDR